MCSNMNCLVVGVDFVEGASPKVMCVLFTPAWLVSGRGQVAGHAIDMETLTRSES